MEIKMMIDASDLLEVATRLESFAKLIREKPEAVKKALLAIGGAGPKQTDPYFLPREQRYAYVNKVAKKLGISARDLLDIYGVFTTGQNSR